MFVFADRCLGRHKKHGNAQQDKKANANKRKEGVGTKSREGLQTQNDRRKYKGQYRKLDKKAAFVHCETKNW